MGQHGCVPTSGGVCASVLRLSPLPRAPRVLSSQVTSRFLHLIIAAPGSVSGSPLQMIRTAAAADQATPLSLPESHPAHSQQTLGWRFHHFEIYSCALPVNQIAIGGESSCRLRLGLIMPGEYGDATSVAEPKTAEQNSDFQVSTVSTPASANTTSVASSILT
jgi:hypothetical protein